MTVVLKKKIKIVEERTAALVKLEKNKKKRFLMIFKGKSMFMDLIKFYNSS